MNRAILSLALLVSIVGWTTVGTANADEGKERLFYVQVTNGEQLEGQISELTEMKLKTEFGEITIPLEKVSAIKLETGETTTAVFAFLNGDVVTGETSFKQLTLETKWGKANINSNAILMIKTTPNGQFVANQGGGWRYFTPAATTLNPGLQGSALPSSNFQNSTPPSNSRPTSFGSSQFSSPAPTRQFNQLPKRKN